MREYVVTKDCLLIDYLINDLKFQKKVAKRLLKENIKINGEYVSNYAYKLKINDRLLIVDKLENNIEIIYEDKDFVVINKPSALLSISDLKENKKTAYHLVREYVNKKHEKIFVLHRIDKDTSGVLVFCKDIKLRNALQEKWNDLVYKRSYYGIVLGKLKEKSGHIENNLFEDKNGRVYIRKNGKKAITDYRVIKETKKYSLLDINIKTGRKNQIRVTFSDLGHALVGDKNYGGIKANRLYLHAYALGFINPLNHKKYEFVSSLPKEFDNFVFLTDNKQEVIDGQ